MGHQQGAEVPTDVRFVMPAAEYEYLSRLLEAENMAYEVTEAPREEDVLSFDVETVRSLIVAVGSTGLITALAKILVVYLKERRKEIAIKAHNGALEITAKNLDVYELEKILYALKSQEMIWIVDMTEFK